MADDRHQAEAPTPRQPGTRDYMKAILGALQQIAMNQQQQIAHTMALQEIIVMRSSGTDAFSQSQAQEYLAMARKRNLEACGFTVEVSRPVAGQS